MKDSIIQSYVEAEFKGKVLKFYPLNMEDTISFLDKWEGNPRDFIVRNEKVLKQCIAKSLKIDEKEIKDASPGFLMLGLEKLMEAIDFDFLFSSSLNLQKKVTEMLKKMEERKENKELKDLIGSQPTSGDLPEKKDGKLDTSSGSLPLSK